VPLPEPAGSGLPGGVAGEALCHDDLKKFSVENLECFLTEN